MGPDGHRPLIHVNGGTTIKVVPPLTRMQMWAVPVRDCVHMSIFLWYCINTCNVQKLPDLSIIKLMGIYMGDSILGVIL